MIRYFFLLVLISQAAVLISNSAAQAAPRELHIASDAWVVQHSCIKRAKAAKFTWAEYKQLLAELKNDRYTVVPLREFAAAADSTANTHQIVVAMRHDMDGNVCKAGTMAGIEQDLGIRSTYFIRPTDLYFGWGWPQVIRREATVPRYQAIQSMDHEMGIHYDMLSMKMDHDLDPAVLLTEDLAWLRERKLEITGAASHGSAQAHKYNFVNYEFFAGMTTRTVLVYGEKSSPLGQHTLAEFGLAYEAYRIGSRVYLSEAGGKWNVADPVQSLRGLPQGSRVQILTHPVWWGSEETSKN